MSLFTEPEEHGLTLVGHVDFSDPEQPTRDYFAVWRDNSGKLFWGFHMFVEEFGKPFSGFTLEDLESGTKDEALTELSDEISVNGGLLRSPTLDHDAAKLARQIGSTGDAWTASGTFA